MYSDPFISLIITCISKYSLSFSMLQFDLVLNLLNTDFYLCFSIYKLVFSSALPLVKSASFILLQGVPNSVPLDQVRAAITAVPGVLNVHGKSSLLSLSSFLFVIFKISNYLFIDNLFFFLLELHIWSLSESKLVASVHVMTEAKDVAHVSKLIRKVMHRFGIHSS